MEGSGAGHGARCLPLRSINMVARGSYQAIEVRVRAWELREKKDIKVGKKGKVKGEEKRGEDRSATFWR